MTTTVEQELKETISQLNEEEQQSILQMLKTFLQGREQKDRRVSIEQYNKELDEALADIEQGQTYSHEEVAKMAKDW